MQQNIQVKQEHEDNEENMQVKQEHEDIEEGIEMSVPTPAMATPRAARKRCRVSDGKPSS